MKICDICNQRLWSTDKGVCPTCRPEENRAIYNLKPFSKEEAIKVKEKMQNRNIERYKPKMVREKTEAQTFLESMVETDGSLGSVVKSYILKVYQESGEHKSNTCKKLGISTRTLYNHLDKYGVV